MRLFYTEKNQFEKFVIKNDYEIRKSLIYIRFYIDRKWRAKYINNISPDVLPTEITTCKFNICF